MQSTFWRLKKIDFTSMYMTQNVLSVPVLISGQLFSLIGYYPQGPDFALELSAPPRTCPPLLLSSRDLL